MAAYARQPVARSAGGWTISGNDASLTVAISFPAAGLLATPTVATFFGVGRDVSGAGELLFFGPIVPTIAIAPGVTPKLDTGTKVSQAAADGMADAAATDLLKLLFNNTDWANLGDAVGVRGSTVAGSLYLSLHTATPTEAGNQSSNEVTYV